MAGGLYSHTTRADGIVLSAAIYNADHQTHITNAKPTKFDDYSVDNTEMQTQTDPYPAAAVSRAETLAGELARIRYQLAQITGETYWYEDIDINLATLSTDSSGGPYARHIEARMFL